MVYKNLKTSLKLNFIVVGGGIAGLTSAISLVRVGHNVTVLEQKEDFRDTEFAAGCRVPPTMSNVLFRWGLEKRVRELSLPSTTMVYLNYESGAFIGEHSWEEDVIHETGGEFLLMHYGDVRQLLYETALEHGAIIRGNVKVVSLNPDASTPSVVLESGEVMEADVLIGADGVSGLSRALLVGQNEHDINLHQTMYNVAIPGDELLKDPTLAPFLSSPSKLYTWLDSSYGVMAFPMIHGDKTDYCMHLWTPKEPETNYIHVSKEDLTEIMLNSEPRLRNLLSKANLAISVPMVERPFLEDWVHESGRLLVIGEAAHPFLPGSLYSLLTAAGDAAFLGRLFAHVRRPEQIPTFLGAVQEERVRWIQEIRATASNNVLAMQLVPAVEGAANGINEAAAQAHQRYSEGVEEIIAPKGDILSMKQEVMANIFAYDAEEAADEWWVQWGVVQERLEGRPDSNSVAICESETSVAS